ncbi:MAG TPA: MarR family transcriptional regulator [Synergistales bacterium]|mgnify:CR=1 FL=1|jgi:DNA-binding MarR family transcriptional regulator|nr:MarR family transcriptional regulator [Synergistales bacterium]HRV71840.1 MarR family transcriptional regulator [Thermovirgaceae bacterium]
MGAKNEARELREATRELFRNLSLLDRDRASCCGVTVAQCHAIVEIGRLGKVSPGMLAETLRLDRSTVTRLADSLVAMDFITREQDPEDRRSLVLALTEKGEQFHSLTEQAMEDFYRSIIQKMPPEERRALITGISAISESYRTGECKCFRNEDKPAYSGEGE